MSWITPIIDRTSSDVAYALVNQNLTSDLKGSWNISDANRIIDNSIFLRDLLVSYGYIISFPNQDYFIESDLPHIDSKMKVLIDNINALCDVFYKQDNPTISYSNVFSYTDANILEINLNILNTLLLSMIKQLRYCNEGYCGDSIFL